MTIEQRDCEILSAYGVHRGSCEVIRFSYLEAAFFAVIPLLIAASLGAPFLVVDDTSYVTGSMILIIGSTLSLYIYRKVNKKLKVINGNAICGKCSQKLCFQLQDVSGSNDRVCPRCATNYSVKITMMNSQSPKGDGYL